ncbi:MAG: 2-C-methyl-D-erythritol 4-phosphate cytidylyltransferase [Erysipelotrichia bacterium]|nr:2-C-methyl-D-erythritol 4-phosphate cytidylyltransferase [Erysipelotrichia bacterium]
MQYSALIVAAGSGSRMGLGYNKVYYRCADGRTILEHTIEVFRRDRDCVQIIAVSDPQDFHEHIKSADVTAVPGGSTRQESVSHGLAEVAADYVFIHDGARPYLDQASLDAMKKALQTEDAACLMVKVKDTIKQVEDGYIASTPDRSKLWAAQTPQAFRTSLLKECMKAAETEGWTGTDDCSLAERYSAVRIKVVEGSYGNYKITTPEDLR